MPDLDSEERQELLAVGRALPPAPGRFPIREDHPLDITHAVHDLNRIPEHERGVVRHHIVRWAVQDGHTAQLPSTWKVRRNNG